MNPSVAYATETVAILAAVEAVDTAGATSLAIDTLAYEGAMLITQNVGVIDDGTITGKIRTGSLANLSDMEDLAGGGFVAVSTTTDPSIQTLVVQANACKRYIQYVGTIVTGVLVPVAVNLTATKKMT